MKAHENGRQAEAKGAQQAGCEDESEVAGHWGNADRDPPARTRVMMTASWLGRRAQTRAPSFLHF